MLNLLRTSPGLVITLPLLLGGALVCLLLAFLMVRAGASLRPLAWFAGFFALIVFPQVIGHLWMARRTMQQPPVPHSTAAKPSVQPGESIAQARTVFGPDVDPTLVLDARGTFSSIGSPAESAQFAVLPDGSSVLLGSFRDAGAAEKAWVNYLRSTGLGQLGGAGDSQRGYAVTPPTGDRAYAVPIGSMFGVWTGGSDAEIVARMQAGGFSIPRGAPILTGATPQTMDTLTHAALPGAGRSLPRAKAAALPAHIAAPALIAYLLVIIIYFFKGAAWAGTSPATPGAERASAANLAERIHSLNTIDVPFAIERGEQENELIATWRYGDAKWIDHARAHGLRRTFRIHMTLDEATHTVRATDYSASYDWSAGPNGAAVTWKAGLGIMFFQRDHTRVFGLQLDEHGRFTPDLTYAYSFNLDEMKAPLRSAVTRAGWSWRPTVWQGPTWLRWLTE